MSPNQITSVLKFEKMEGKRRFYDLPTEQRFIHMIEYLKGNKHLKSNIEI